MPSASKVFTKTNGNKRKSYIANDHSPAISTRAAIKSETIRPQDLQPHSRLPRLWIHIALPYCCHSRIHFLFLHLQYHRTKWRLAQNRFTLPMMDSLLWTDENFKIPKGADKSAAIFLFYNTMTRWYGSRKEYYAVKATHRTLYTTQWELHTVHYKLYTIHCTLYTIHYKMYTI